MVGGDMRHAVLAGWLRGQAPPPRTFSCCQSGFLRRSVVSSPACDVTSFGRFDIWRLYTGSSWSDVCADRQADSKQASDSCHCTRRGGASLATTVVAES